MSMRNQPLISIIVPVYRVEKYLKKCVDSLINQTYKNLEIILVDDGSPDNCPIVCDTYAKIDSRIVVIHKENGGLSDARNAGLDIASGEYIGFVDSDDYISPDMYEALLRGLTEDNSDIACCNYLQVNEEGTAYKDQELPIKDECLDSRGAYELLIKYGGYYAVAWNKLYRRQIWETIRYPKGRKYEDMFVICALIEQCAKISHVNSPLYYYVRREGSITSEERSIKDFDLGFALIQMRSFAISHKIGSLRKYSTNRLAYKIEEWWKLCENDSALRERFVQLCKKSWFLLIDRYAWESYSWKGKIVARICFLRNLLNLSERM